MGTGVTFSLSPPDYFVEGKLFSLVRKIKETYFADAKKFVPSKLDNAEEEELLS